MKKPRSRFGLAVSLFSRVKNIVLWFSRTHLRLKISDIACHWVHLSTYMIIVIKWEVTYKHYFCKRASGMAQPRVCCILMQANKIADIMLFILYVVHLINNQSDVQLLELVTSYKIWRRKWVGIQNFSRLHTKAVKVQYLLQQKHYPLQSWHASYKNFIFLLTIPLFFLCLPFSHRPSFGHFQTIPLKKKEEGKKEAR